MSALVMTALVSNALSGYAIGDSWSRQNDFVSGVAEASTENNPSVDFAGNPAWHHAFSFSGGDVDWWRTPNIESMVWDEQWWNSGRGAWTRSPSNSAVIFSDWMTHDLDHEYVYVPVVEWMNPVGESVIDISGDFEILWSGPGFVGQDTAVRVVMGVYDGTSVEPFYHRRYEKPNPGATIGDSISVDVDLTGIELAANETIVYSVQAENHFQGTGAWIDMNDNLTFTLGAIPAPGAALVLLAGGLRRRTR